jgi:hypothetical protein
MFWKRKTQGAEHERAVELGSRHWRSAIDRLKQEADEQAVERAATIA